MELVCNFTILLQNFALLIWQKPELETKLQSFSCLLKGFEFLHSYIGREMESEKFGKIFSFIGNVQSFAFEDCRNPSHLDQFGRLLTDRETQQFILRGGG